MGSVTSGTRPTRPSDSFSASLYAVALLTDGLRSNSTPCKFVVMIFVTSFPISDFGFERSYRAGKLRFPSAGFCNVRTNHLLRVDDPVELVFRYKSQLQRGFFESEVVIKRVMCYLRRLVVPDDGRERRHEH